MVATIGVDAFAAAAVAPIRAVGTLVNVNAAEAPECVRVAARPRHVARGDELSVEIGRECAELLASARVVAVEVDAVRVGRAPVWRSCWQRRGERALVDVRAEEAGAPVACARARALVTQSARAQGADEIGARGMLAAQVRAGPCGVSTFVHIRARDAVARVARRTGAAKGARQVGAVIGAELAVVRAFGALVDLGACGLSGAEARRAGACAVGYPICGSDEMRPACRAAQAHVRPCPVARDARRVARDARCARAIVAQRADSKACGPEKIRRKRGARGALGA